MSTSPSTTAAPQGATTTEAEPSTSGPGEPNPTDAQDTTSWADGGVEPGATSPPPPPPPTADGGGPSGDGFTPPPVPTRKRSILGQLTFGVALITVGVLWILEVTSVVALGPLRIMAIGLAVLGAGLLVGSVLGRARWLIVIGVLLVPLVLVGSALRGLPAGDLLDASLRGSPVVGERIETPLEATEFSEGYALGAGRLELDLRELEFDEDVSGLIEVGAGEVLVIVPDDINIDVRSSIAGGEITLFGRSRAGLAVDSQSSREAGGLAPGDAPTLSLRINVGFGDVTVRD